MLMLHLAATNKVLCRRSAVCEPTIKTRLIHSPEIMTYAVIMQSSSLVSGKVLKHIVFFVIALDTDCHSCRHAAISHV
jgi:hypothetical protein